MIDLVFTRPSVRYAKEISEIASKQFEDRVWLSRNSVDCSLRLSTRKNDAARMFAPGAKTKNNSIF